MHELAASLSTGADINQKPRQTPQFVDVFSEGKVQEFEFITDLYFEAPLNYAIWIGEVDIVKCLLGLDVVPDVICLHIAAALHRVDILDILLLHQNCPFRTIDECDFFGKSLFHSALSESVIFSPLKRVSTTHSLPEESCRSMIRYLLSMEKGREVANRAHVDLWNLCCRSHSSSIENLHQLFVDGLVQRDYKSKGLLTAIAWHNEICLEYILNTDVNTARVSSSLPSPLHACAMYASSVSFLRRIKDKGYEINTKQNQKFRTDLETPFQPAVAFGNFEAANFLFEEGANRDAVISSSVSSLQDCTLLGWLVKMIWSETQERVHYLFEKYPQEPPPRFLVAPNAGRSALQQAAMIGPANSYDEQDAYDLMQYLTTKYPGSRHIEYQRMDNAASIQGDNQYSGSVHKVTAEGKSALEDNTSHFSSNVKEYTPSKLRENNGTALHFAVRSVNFRAVEALLQAGANPSAVMGLATGSTSMSRDSSSTYATRENSWASSVMEFALLTRDRMDDGEYPVSMPDQSPRTINYFKQRICDIIELLRKADAALTTKFLRKRNEARLYRERRQKGNLAALRMFRKEIAHGLGQGLRLGKKAFKDSIEEQQKSQDNQSATFRALSDLADGYRRQRRFDDALRLYNEAREKIGNDYKSLALCTYMVNMGDLFVDRGEHDEAESWYLKAISQYESNLGRKDLKTFTAIHSLGNLYLDIGRLSEAEPLLREALEGREILLGPLHESTLASILSLGSLHDAQANLKEAEKSFRDVITGFEESELPGTVTVLRAYHNLGSICIKLGNLGEAENMLKKALDGRESLYGPEHPETLGSVKELALLYKRKGEQDKAESLYRRAWKGLTAIYGNHNKGALSAAYTLGYMFSEQGRLQEAEEILRQVLEGEKKAYGIEDNNTIITMSQLANLCRRRGNHDESLALYQRTLRSREKTLGLDHKDTMDTHYNLAILHNAMKNLGLAVSSYEIAEEGYRKKLGEHNSETLEAMEQKARILCTMGLFDDAETAYIKILRGRETTLGLEHPDTLTSIADLAEVRKNVQIKAVTAKPPEKGRQWT